MVPVKVGSPDGDGTSVQCLLGGGETFSSQDEQPWEPLKHTADVTGSLERGRVRVWQEKPPPCWCSPC